MTENATKSSVAALLSGIKSAASPFRTYLQDLHAGLAGNSNGAVATYIPELAKADPKWFGVSVVTLTGSQYNVGDHAQRFTIQSVSKAFMYGLALEKLDDRKAYDPESGQVIPYNRNFMKPTAQAQG